MRTLRRGLILFVCLVASQVWAAAPSTVYVSTGTAGKIFAINTSNSAVTQFYASPIAADFEGMVVAPDNTIQGAADLSTHYLLYVCDTANSKIYRFDPSTPTTRNDEISGGAVSHPQCGRITSTGDLVVSSTDAGSGLWVFQDVTDHAINGGVLSPTPLAAVSGSSKGIAQKNTGDLLVVDSTNNAVLRAPLTAPSAAKPFISSGLTGPFGIARRSDGSIFVSNQSGHSANVTEFNPQGQSPSTCQTFKSKDVPNHLQAAIDDTLYIAVASGTNGYVRSVNGSTCGLIQTYTLAAPAVGLALSPDMTASQAVHASGGQSLNNFGFAAFGMSLIANNAACAGTVSVDLASPALIQVYLNKAGTPAMPAVNLALDGFEAVIDTSQLPLSGCPAADGNTNNVAVSHFYATTVNNPQIFVCDDIVSSCESVAVSPGDPLNVSQIAAYPLQGFLKNDPTSVASKSLRCKIFMASAVQQDTQPTGTFCGFQSPLTNTWTRTLDSWDPSGAAVLSDGKSVPVKFKLATGAGNTCQGAPYINNAVAILSVAQIADSKGAPTFVPIGLISNGSSGLAQPLFKGDTNNQYLFNWDSSSCIMPSGVTQVCPKGTYSVTVVLLTNNTVGGAQSIYGQQTTLVKLK